MNENKVGCWFQACFIFLSARLAVLKGKKGGPSRSERCCKLFQGSRVHAARLHCPVDLASKILTNENPCGVGCDPKQYIFPANTDRILLICTTALIRTLFLKNLQLYSLQSPSRTFFNPIQPICQFLIWTQSLWTIPEV